MLNQYPNDVRFEDLSSKAKEAVEVFRKFVTDPPEGIHIAGRHAYSNEPGKAALDCLSFNLEGILYSELFKRGCGAQDMLNTKAFAQQHNYWRKS